MKLFMFLFWFGDSASIGSTFGPIATIVIRSIFSKTLTSDDLSTLICIAVLQKEKKKLNACLILQVMLILYLLQLNL